MAGVRSTFLTASAAEAPVKGSSAFWTAANGRIEFFKARIDLRFDRHFHDKYAFGVITGGTESFRYRGATHDARRGTTAILHPGEVHDGFPGKDGHWTYRMTYIDPVLFEEIAADAGAQSKFGRTGRPLFVNAVFEDPELAPAFLDMHRHSEVCADPLDLEERFLGILRQLLVRQAKATEPVPVDTLPSLVPLNTRGSRGALLAADFIRADLAAKHDLQTLAAIAGLSQFGLIRAFNSAYGMPPHAWHTQMRISVSEKLIRAGKPLAQVSTDLGFCDQAHFSRLFKRVRGMSPGVFAAAYGHPASQHFVLNIS